jgi:hypothetical protein
MKCRIWTRIALMSLVLMAGSRTARALDACGDEMVAARVSRPALQLAVGFDAHRAWISAQYRQLGIRKQTTRETRATAIELRYGPDSVTVSLAAHTIVVSRGGRSVVLDSPEALEPLQDLLGGSTALFAARAMLSELEQDDDLRAPEMSLLSSLAFVASLAGDVNAPRRLADRFVAKYRGVVRPIRWESSCWGDYTKETTAAWDELQTCMQEADQDDSMTRAVWRRIACNATWMGRSESAWFEFLGCIQPLKTVK